MKAFHTCLQEIGIDEAGRGPFLGRVYAAAVAWPSHFQPENTPDFINDSKKLSVKKRKIAHDWILQHIEAWGIGFAEAAEIDELNILEATRLAMSRAIVDLKQRCPSTVHHNHLLIDGVRWEGKFGDEYKVSSVVAGDGKYLSIASASILAKEAHDAHIRDLCDTHPEWDEQYGLSRNMGYGTKEHIQGIQTHGTCEQHRKSFKRCGGSVNNE